MAIKKLKNSTGSINSGSITTSNAGHYWGTTTTNTVLGVSPITTTAGGLLMNGSGLQQNTISWPDGTFVNSDIVEYIDIFYQFMGIDMDYKRFSEMTEEEKKGFIRDLKIKKLIDDK